MAGRASGLLGSDVTRVFTCLRASQRCLCSLSRHVGTTKPFPKPSEDCSTPPPVRSPTLGAKACVGWGSGFCNPTGLNEKAVLVLLPQAWARCTKQHISDRLCCCCTCCNAQVAGSGLCSFPPRCFASNESAFHSLVMIRRTTPPALLLQHFLPPARPLLPTPSFPEQQLQQLPKCCFLLRTQSLRTPALFGGHVRSCQQGQECRRFCASGKCSGNVSNSCPC